MKLNFFDLFYFTISVIFTVSCSNIDPVISFNAQESESENKFSSNSVNSLVVQMNSESNNFHLHGKINSSIQVGDNASPLQMQSTSNNFILRGKMKVVYE